MQLGTIPVFDDLPSYGHAALGLLASRTKLSLAVFLAFVAYQLNEVEPMENKTGDFLEYGTGYLLGKWI